MEAIEYYIEEVYIRTSLAQIYWRSTIALYIAVFSMVVLRDFIDNVRESNKRAKIIHQQQERIKYFSDNQAKTMYSSFQNNIFF